MAFVQARLTLADYTGGAQGYSKWHYDAQTDTLATVLAADYFLTAMTDTATGRPFEVGDKIEVEAADGAAVLRVDTITTGASAAMTTEMGFGESQWVTAELTDVSTASSTWLAAPFDGFIRRVKTILHGAIITANAAVGLELAGTDVTGGQLTIAFSGSAAGDVDETVATALNTVSEGDAVEFDTDGASANAISVTVMVEFIPG